MNQTPLMAAAAAGNMPLVEALLERGANLETTDQYGYNALHYAMGAAFHDAKFARSQFAALYELLAPPGVDANTGDRLVRIDRHLSEYFLFQTLWVLFKSRFTHRQRRLYAFEPYPGWNRIEEYCALANMPKPAAPIAIERVIARREATEIEAMKRWQEQLELSEKPKWGTKETRRRKIERVRKEIEDRKK